MSIFQAIILGIIQGISEFLPISSSGHLILARAIFGWDTLDSGKYVAFDVALHFGTLIAVLSYFRKEIIEIISTKNIRVIVGVGISAIPGFLAGYFLEDFAGSRLSSPVLVAIVLGVVGLILYVVDVWAEKSAVPKSSDLDKRDEGYKKVLGDYKKMLIIGLAQCLALQPGVSRSGATMAAGRVMKLSRETSAKVSFFAIIPIVSGATFYELISGKFESGLLTQSLIGALASGIVGFFAIGFLLKIVKKVGYGPFAFYRVCLGVIGVVLLWIM